MSVPSPDNAARPPRLVRLKRRLLHLSRIGLRAIWQGFVEFTKSENLTFAASIAYYSLLSIFPFSLLVLAVSGRIQIGTSGASLLQLVMSAMPAEVEFLVRIETLSESAVQLGAMGTFLMMWASMGVFGALTSAINHAWGVEQPPGFFKHKLIAFIMLLGAGLLMVITLLLLSAAQVVETTWFARQVGQWDWLDPLRGFVARHLHVPMFTLVVGLVYYYVPNAKVRLRDAFMGALVAGLLWQLAFLLFSWYLRDLSRFTNIHGSIGAVIAFLLWIYASAVVLLYGAEVSAAFARLRKHLPPAAPAAAERDKVT
jgi:membrane protein